MPESVRRDSLAYAGFLGKVAHDIEYHHACEMCAASVMEQVVFLSRFYRCSYLVLMFQIQAYLLYGSIAHRYHALFAALAGNSEESIVKKYAATLESA